MIEVAAAAEVVVLEKIGTPQASVVIYQVKGVSKANM
jgi:hypothetical protein